MTRLSDSEPRPEVQIEPGLWLGDLEHSQDPDFIAQHEIGAIVSITHTQPNEQLMASWNSPDIRMLVPTIRHVQLLIPDEPDETHRELLHLLPWLCDFIDSMDYTQCGHDGTAQGPHNVLVHCDQPTASASAAVVTAFLMLKYNEPAPVAFGRVEAQCPGIELSPGHRQHLALWGSLGCQLCVDEAGTIPKPLYARFVLRRNCRHRQAE
jgi:hypothetical protein